MKTVKPSEAQMLVHQVAQNLLMMDGFSGADRGVLSRCRTPWFTDLFRASVNRGVIAVDWGFQLNYVPAVVNTKVVQTRSRSYRGVFVANSLDLGQRIPDGRIAEISWLQTEESVLQQAKELVPAMIDVARKEWATVSNVEAVRDMLEALKRQLHGKHHDFWTFPNLSLSLAFSQAVLGENTAAISELQEYFCACDTPDELRSRLLDEISNARAARNDVA